MKTLFAILFLFTQEGFAAPCFELIQKVPVERSGSPSPTSAKSVDLSLSAVLSGIAQRLNSKDGLSLGEAAKLLPANRNRVSILGSMTMPGDEKYSEDSAKAWAHARFSEDGTSQRVQIQQALIPFGWLLSYANDTSSLELLRWVIVATDSLFEAIVRQQAQGELNSQNMSAITTLQSWQRTYLLELESFYTKPVKALGEIQNSGSTVLAYADVLEERIARLLMLPAPPDLIQQAVVEEYNGRNKSHANRLNGSINNLARSSSPEQRAGIDSFGGSLPKFELSAIHAAAKRLERNSSSGMDRRVLQQELSLALKVIERSVRTDRSDNFLRPSLFHEGYIDATRIFLQAFEYSGNLSANLENGIFQLIAHNLFVATYGVANSKMPPQVAAQIALYNLDGVHTSRGTLVKMTGIWENVLLLAPPSLILYYTQLIKKIADITFQHQADFPVSENQLYEKFEYPIRKVPFGLYLAFNPNPIPPEVFSKIEGAFGQRSKKGVEREGRNSFLFAMILRYFAHPELATELKKVEDPDQIYISDLEYPPSLKDPRYDVSDYSTPKAQNIPRFADGSEILSLFFPDRFADETEPVLWTKDSLAFSLTYTSPLFQERSKKDLAKLEQWLGTSGLDKKFPNLIRGNLHQLLSMIILHLPNNDPRRESLRLLFDFLNFH